MNKKVLLLLAIPVLFVFGETFAQGDGEKGCEGCCEWRRANCPYAQAQDDEERGCECCCEWRRANCPYAQAQDNEERGCECCCEYCPYVQEKGQSCGERTFKRDGTGPHKDGRGPRGSNLGPRDDCPKNK